ncbi:MAG: two-component regulator propeller domain-containing protein [Cytophagales bacterium]|nr:two-component regulator propeller domain-containing protein [Cytophagales bacterium]
MTQPCTIFKWVGKPFPFIKCLERFFGIDQLLTFFGAGANNHTFLSTDLMRLLLVICCLTHALPFLWGQGNQLRFYDHSSGLESKWAGLIKVSANGEIWMINNDDIIRYNGYEKKIVPLSSDPNNPVYVNAFELDNNVIWIGTQNELIRYDLITLEQDILAIGAVVALHLDQSGELWVSSEKGLVRIVQDQSITFLQDSTDWGSLMTFDLQNDESGKLWIATENRGLITYDIESKDFHDVEGLYNAKGEPQLKMRDLLLDKDGSIWAGSSGGGLFHLKEDSISQFLPSQDPGAISSTEAYTLEQDESGNLWIGTWAGGLNFFDVSKEEFTRYRAGDVQSKGLPSNVVVDLEINDDQLWVGTAYSGPWMTQLNDQAFTWWNKKSLPGSLESDNFWAIHEDASKNLWLGTYQGGLYKISSDNEFTHFKSFEDIPANTIWSIYENKAGLWIGTNLGLLWQSPGKEEWSFFSTSSNTPKGWEANNIFMIEGTEELLYLGIWGAGVFAYDIQQNSVRKILKKSYLSDLELTREGKLWITGNSELFIYDPTEDSMARPVEDPGLAPRPSMLIEAFDGLWLSNKEGLYHWENDAFNRIDHELLRKVFNPIEAKDSTIWMSTASGIVTLSKDRSQITLIPEQDRTITTTPNARAVARSSDGKLYFGGLNGIVSFDPKQVKMNNPLPEIQIDAFNIGNEQILTHEGKTPDYISTFNLTYKDLVFSLDFSALNYTHPDKISYAYQLSGLGDEWIFTSASNRKASFAGLSSGQYQFHVKARNPGGEWGPTKSLDIYVAPPWWKTNFTYSLYVFAMCLIIFFFHHMRMVGLKRNQKLLKTEIARQTQRLQENNEELAAKNKELKSLSKFKEGLTHMIVHDMKNPLNAVIGLTEGKPTRDNMSQIRQSGQTILQMITNMLDIQKFEEVDIKVNPEAINLYSLVFEAKQEVKMLLDTRGIILQNTISNDILVYIDKNIILRVFVNLFTNAIKYSSSGTKITVSANMIEDRILIDVKDQGTGISKEILPNIFNKFWQYKARKSGEISSTGLGLTYSKLAIESHKGKINVISEPGQGSTFQFDLPFHGRSDESIIPEEQQIENEYSELAKRKIQALAIMIKDIPLYNVGKIMKILNESDEDDALSEVERWKSSVLDATYHHDKDRFEELISI